MAETVKVEVDLDLNPKLAKEKLDTFKKSVQNEAIPVKLDLDNAKGDALYKLNRFNEALKTYDQCISYENKIEDDLEL